MYHADDKHQFEAAKKALEQLTDADRAMVIAVALTGMDSSEDFADFVYNIGGDEVADKLARFAKVSA